MEMLVVFPEQPPPDLARTLDLAGYQWKGVSGADDAARSEPGHGWVGAVVNVDPDPEAAWALCRSLRKRNEPVRLLVLVGGGSLPDLDLRDDLFDDFCLTPFHPVELESRLRHLLYRRMTATNPEMIEYAALALNLETYQATIDGTPLDLTYMEYELLKFLAQNPGKVFTREMLLSRVWGYEYYGGARTVDVHVRRLRAKLGEEQANLIQTVRSVGYRFGQSRWNT
jgi:two-component system, OmpR family, alkaline phosphatase synthesis response regulator PhoP